MENNIFRQSSFSRTIINEAKMGAYYTDAEHCRRIGRLLDFPEEFIALEPSIGDGSAIAATLEEATVMPKIYGVELNQNTYEEIKDDERFYVLPADFLTGVVVSNRVFSYCFSNPPYGVGEDGKTRLEKSFLEKISNYMCPEGILVYVIPYQVLQEERFLRSLFSRFTPLAVFKFDDKEFEKYHQVVVIAQKRSREGYLRDWYEKFKEQISEISNISYLPTIDEPVDRKIPVPPSSDEKLTYFTTREFDAENAGKRLMGSNLYLMIGKKGILPSYTATELGHPAIPLKKDLLYLCAISGGGQGLTGSEENRDLHLQRGVAKVVTNQFLKKKEKIRQNVLKLLLRKSLLILLRMMELSLFLNSAQVFNQRFWRKRFLWKK